jgi:hypothetical protein
MNMVGHQAKGMNTGQKSLTRFLEDLVKAIAVLVIREDVLTGIAAKDHVV